MIGGVCGGLGRYFNVDPILFRIGIAVLALVGGAGLLLYLAALLLVPASRRGPGAEPAGGRPLPAVVVGRGGAPGRRWPFLLGGGLVAAAVLVPSRPSLSRAFSYGGSSRGGTERRAA